MNNKDLYVRNISFDATEEDIRKLFSVCGTVKSIHMMTDPKTGLFKGSCFVKMSTNAEMRDAVITLDEAMLINRVISVTEALPQNPKGQSPKSGPKQGKAPGKKR